MSGDTIMGEIFAMPSFDLDNFRWQRVAHRIYNRKYALVVCSGWSNRSGALVGTCQYGNRYAVEQWPPPRD